MYCLRFFFYKNYIAYYREYSLKSRCIPRLVAVSVSYMPIYVPIVMYGLRMLIVVSQELATMFTMMFTC